MTKSITLKCTNIIQTHTNRKNAAFINEDKSNEKLLFSLSISFNSTLVEHEIFQIGQEYNFVVPVNPIEEIEERNTDEKE